MEIGRNLRIEIIVVLVKVGDERPVLPPELQEVLNVRELRQLTTAPIVGLLTQVFVVGVVHGPPSVAEGGKPLVHHLPLGLLHLDRGLVGLRAGPERQVWSLNEF